MYTITECTSKPELKSYAKREDNVTITHWVPEKVRRELVSVPAGECSSLSLGSTALENAFQMLGKLLIHIYPDAASSLLSLEVQMKSCQTR